MLVGETAEVGVGVKVKVGIDDGDGVVVWVGNLVAGVVNA